MAWPKKRAISVAVSTNRICERVRMGIVCVQYCVRFRMFSFKIHSLMYYVVVRITSIA